MEFILSNSVTTTEDVFQFSEKDTTTIQKYFQHKKHNSNCEIEFVRNITPKQKNTILPLTTASVKRIMMHFKQQQILPEQETTLDISLKLSRTNLRGTLHQEEHIRNCCENTNMQSSHFTWMEKTRTKLPANDLEKTRKELSSYELEDFDYHLNAKEERLHPNLSKEEWIQFVNSDKHYRHKKRYKFRLFENTLSLDITLVREGNGTTFQQANVLNQPQKVEIEIEWFPQSRIDDVVIMETISHVRQLLIILESLAFNIPCKMPNSFLQGIKTQYFTILGVSGSDSKPLPKSNIGPDLVSLEFVHLQTIKENSGSKSNLVPIYTRTANNIPENGIDFSYMVTLKTDGVRCLGFIYNQCLYILNNNDASIQCSGIYLIESFLNNTILDGELVIYEKNGKRCFDYYPFDIYVYNGNEQRHLNFETRFMTKLESLVHASFIPISNEMFNTSNVLFTIKRKQFLPCTPENCSRLLNLAQTPDLEFETDGLVFIPNVEMVGNQPYHILDPAKMKSDKSDANWRIATKKRWNVLLKWKPPQQTTIDFLVKYENRFMALLQIKTKEKQAYQTFAKLKREELPYDMKDGCIMEAHYDPISNKWKPYRIREDKLEPNFIDTANAIWNNIQHPITIELLTNSNAEERSAQCVLLKQPRYYATSNVQEEEGGEKSVLYLFNNQVKHALIDHSLALSNTQTHNQILDLASGRGGDQTKWLFHDKVQTYTAIEKIAMSIDEAKRRLDALNRKDREKIQGKQIEHYVGDLSTEQGYEVLYAKPSYDIVSIQFAIHYLFDTEQSLRMLLQNVSDHLGENGLFIATCFAGERLHELFSSNQQIELEFKNKQEQVICKLVKKYEDAQYQEQEFGLNIDVLIERIGEVHTESLVKTPTLIRIALEYQLELVETKSFEQYTHCKFYKELKQEGNLQEIAFLNNTFIFQKKTSILPSKTGKPHTKRNHALPRLGEKHTKKQPKNGNVHDIANVSIEAGDIVKQYEIYYIRQLHDQSCFIDSGMQLLFQTPEFVTLVQSNVEPMPENPQQPINVVERPRCIEIVDALRQVINTPTAELYAVFKYKIREHFFNNDQVNQQDVHEFLNHVLNCCNDFYNIKLFQHQEQLIDSDNKRRLTTHNILCLECNSTISFQQLVVNATLPRIEGTTEKNSTTSLINFQSHLIIELKRFYYDKETKTTLKNNLSITIPANLTLEQKQYELYGAIFHIGPSPNGGHYTSWFKHTNEIWYQANDVLKQPISAIMTDPFSRSSQLHKAYILFYRQL